MVAVAQSWLEHPVVAREVGGSIPLSHPIIPSWLNWIEHWVSAPAVTGSNPVEGTLIQGEKCEKFNFKNKYC